MGNLTLAIDEDLLRRARVRAADQDTSVNAVDRGALGDGPYPGPTEQVPVDGQRQVAHQLFRFCMCDLQALNNINPVYHWLRVTQSPQSQPAPKSKMCPFTQSGAT